MRGHLVAVDIGGSKIAFLAREVGSGRDVYRRKLQTPARGGVEAMLRLLDAHIANVPGGRKGVRALGVAVPGLVDSLGNVLRAGNLHGWVDVPLRTLLENRYQVPVYVERDANCGALGEKWIGAAKGMHDFVFLALGTGVGAGIHLDGRIYRGAHFAAGEVGDMSFLAGKPKDDRPRPPTVSEVVGKRAIKQEAKRATGEKMSADEALDRARTESRLAPIARKVVEQLSTSVLAISTILDPEAILFGGGTSDAGEALVGRIRKRVAPWGVRTRLMLARLGSRAQLYGALWGAQMVLSRTTAKSRQPT